jgi:hypothetical protein
VYILLEIEKLFPLLIGEGYLSAGLLAEGEVKEQQTHLSPPLRGEEINEKIVLSKNTLSSYDLR